MSSSNLVARLRASPWTSIFARVFTLAAALAVLAWIGRVATANANAPLAAPSVSATAPSLPVFSPTSLTPPSPPLLAAASTPAPPPSPSSPPSSNARGRATPDDPVFLNQADEAELRRLPGVGSKRAEAIVTLRRRVGRFHRVEDLMRVKGIGRAAIKKWRPLVRLDAPPADAGAP